MLTDHELITRFLRAKVAGDPFDSSFIHEADPYSASPMDLVRDREHAPGAERGDGKGRVWLFFRRARCYGSTGRHKRTVAGEGPYFWHPEGRRKDVKDEDGRTVGYLTKLSYVTKESKPGASRKITKRHGWCMAELESEQQDDSNPLVLCKLYKSAQAEAAGQGDPLIDQKSFSDDHNPMPVYPNPNNEPTICQLSEAASIKEAWNGEKAAAAAGFTVVMKFGGSSVSSAKRMTEVASLIQGVPEERPVIVLSAMGKTTNNILQAAKNGVSWGTRKVSDIPELAAIKELHLGTVDELGLDRLIVSGLLDDLEKLLESVGIVKDLTPRTQDFLVSFGECMSTRIFSAYFNKLEKKKTRQYDAFDIGFITTDDFTNADILDATYPAVAKRLLEDWIDEPAIPIVTGFLGKGLKSGAVTTLGRGGSDLTATSIGKALGLREIQIWKVSNVDGVLTCDPKICEKARPVPYLTFDEAVELACSGAQVLHLQSMRLAREVGIPVRVKSSYNPQAPGTVITKTRNMSKSILTSIVLKSNIVILDIESRKMLGQCDFQAQVYSIFKDLRIPVDCVAASGDKLSLTLDPSKLWSHELIQQELDIVVEGLEKIAVVDLRQNRSIISFIGNTQRLSLILEKALVVVRRNYVHVQISSQGTSKVLMVVPDSEAKHCVTALHSAFLHSRFFSEVEGSKIPVNSSSAAPSKRKAAAEDHPDARPAARQAAQAKDEEDEILPADGSDQAASLLPVPPCAQAAPCSVRQQTDSSTIPVKRKAVEDNQPAVLERTDTNDWTLEEIERHLDEDNSMPDDTGLAAFMNKLDPIVSSTSYAHPIPIVSSMSCAHPTPTVSSTPYADPPMDEYVDSLDAVDFTWSPALR